MAQAKPPPPAAATSSFWPAGSPWQLAPQSLLGTQTVPPGQEMCGHGSKARREVPEKERRYLDALVRGVYAKRNIGQGETLSRDDVYFSIPLLKGQISTREFVEGEIATRSIAAHEAVGVENIDTPFLQDSELVQLILDRGLEVSPAEPKRAIA